MTASSPTSSLVVGSGQEASLALEVRRMLVDALAAFPWTVAITDWTGARFEVGGTTPHWSGRILEIRLGTPSAGRDLLRLNGLGLLDRCVRGEVHISGNLYVLTYLRDYMKLDLTWWRLARVLIVNGLFQTVRRAGISIRAHYDIPQAALELYLDKIYMAYSCAMFEEPGRYDVDELARAGAGEVDDFDSLEKAQWRKFKDAVDFISPADGDTLLDVGCGYGGQLAVALESYPFGKVVGCTHSRNQAVEGRTRLSRFASDRWELLQADYREDTRVFDHVTSTGMISHVGPRGLVPYVRNIRARIARGGRYVHHALMTPFSRTPLDGQIGAAFNKKYVWPGFHWFPLGDHVRALERNGFEVQKILNLSPHYAKTAAAWYERLRANEERLIELVGLQTFRAWQIYLGGGSGSFLSRKVHVYRVYCTAI